MRTSRRSTTFLVTALFLCVACAGKPDPVEDGGAGSALLDTTWKIVSLDGADVIAGDGPQAPHLILESNDGKLVGSAGVNRFFGSYALPDGPRGAAITLVPSGATRMAGPEPLMKQEQLVLERLQEVDGFRLEGETLTLRVRGRDAMVLRAARAVGP